MNFWNFTQWKFVDVEDLPFEGYLVLIGENLRSYWPATIEKQQLGQKKGST